MEFLWMHKNKFEVDIFVYLEDGIICNIVVIVTK